VHGRRTLHTLEPRVLRWVRGRAGLVPAELATKMGVQSDRVLAWETSGRISLAQVDRLAGHTCTPLGYLFLKAPPNESLAIPDYRTLTGASPVRPTPDLLENRSPHEAAAGLDARRVGRCRGGPSFLRWEP